MHFWGSNRDSAERLKLSPMLLLGVVESLRVKLESLQTSDNNNNTTTNGGNSTQVCSRGLKGVWRGDPAPGREGGRDGRHTIDKHLKEDWKGSKKVPTFGGEKMKMKMKTCSLWDDYMRRNEKYLTKSSWIVRKPKRILCIFTLAVNDSSSERHLTI